LTQSKGASSIVAVTVAIIILGLFSFLPLLLFVVGSIVNLLQPPIAANKLKEGDMVLTQFTPYFGNSYLPLCCFQHSQECLALTKEQQKQQQQQQQQLAALSIQSTTINGQG
jgi:hypothetical protein